MEMNVTPRKDRVSLVVDHHEATTMPVASFQKQSREGNRIGMHMYTDHNGNNQQNYAASRKQSLHLQSTFDGFHNFLVDGPRKRPFSLGLGIPEISLLLPEDNHDHSKTYNDLVSFYQIKGAYYAAAWLSTTETFLTNPHLADLERKNHQNKSTHGWSLEVGTWVGVRGRKNHRTIDMLDFFVHHLSRYKGAYSVRGPDQITNWKMYLAGLNAMQYSYEEQPFNNPNMDRNGRVLVICPFHGTSDNHSGQDEKRLHLNVTIKALARVFPNIVVTVCDAVHWDYVANTSGLAGYLYDVLLVKNLSMAPIVKCTHLPFLSNVQVRRLLQEGYYWIYYTESEQPPHLTNLNALLKETLHNRTVVVPHRSQPVALPRDLNVSIASKRAQRFLQITNSKVLY